MILIKVNFIARGTATDTEQHHGYECNLHVHIS